MGNSTAPEPSAPIELQVGERQFITTCETLVTGSTFFSSLLSGRWNPVMKDGRYFIDADPNAFEDILRYLRHNALPIFYDNKKGHDHVRYANLLKEAQYFGIERLEKYLENREYVGMVTVERWAEEEYTQLHSTWHPLSLHERSDSEVEYHPTWGVRKVYVCPRGIALHRGNRRACGKLCMARNDGIKYEDEPVLKVVAVKTWVSIRM
ncbi:hypothetical protein BDW59DRAFT_136677 [Aspergillus cavernicola]|uniref:BTB domain-containing protein n=1 Tax=Aspergillus cavernicola TaxID=176166 RepID=A0ABR4HMF5_9EURO